ncbi:uncharacterized protein BX663DRAFT_487464 [Cokeromyces recurvatus]|uniref:uncharacterized protein n=1 Tax=Cokeromyces recurvatus TaxID=90255 RepID=UPI00221E9AE2|nr:uncharacterized protein BX663DRAFT_487464 [Cokeromyces recurvatus]KAI7901763.1 hypothetical protein BX663DRAFT_487464 [Cokeromyces recurvatus]
MNYLKKSIKEKTLTIKDFFKDLNAAYKNDDDKAFRKLIKKMPQFYNVSKNKDLIAFAQKMKASNFGILGSREAYEHWNETIKERNILKRVYAHLNEEEQITDEIVQTTSKKQKEIDSASPAKTISRSPSNISQSSSVILANIWSI